MRSLRLLVVAAVGSTVLGTMSPGFAAEGVNAPSPTLEERVKELNQKVLDLEKRRQEDDAKAKDAPMVGAGEDGFFLRSASGDFQLKLRGYVQTDGRFFLEDDRKPAIDQFLLRRVRPIVEGTMYRYFDFRIMPDFGGGKVELQDAYLDIRYWSQAKLRAGKFKGPVGLERLQSGTDLLFVERALPTNLVPNRELGFQLHGDLLGGALSYAVGVFNGVADGASSDGDSGDDKEFEGRLFAHPFRNSAITPLQGLGLGVAGSYGTTDGTLPGYKSPGQNTFFSYKTGSTASGIHYRIAPQGYYYQGPFGIFGEYVVSSQDVRNGAEGKELHNTSWQVAASYVVTGDKASYKGVVPKQKFDPRNGAWGALEIAARYAELSVDRDAFPIFADPASAARKARAWGVGTNWYLNKSVKIVLNYEQTAFDGGAAGGADREDERVVLSRLQVAY
ncbi:porin [Geobacter sp.]|uniref:OprO/OprP family phosphate-selective porin n=1 Tax=Geobacter sp. TaxID=46610 RepID=UPI0026218E52|nr:porin [Geobacter sp.]